jgi:hypothetical protein
MSIVVVGMRAEREKNNKVEIRNFFSFFFSLIFFTHSYECRHNAGGRPSL